MSDIETQAVPLAVTEKGEPLCAIPLRHRGWFIGLVELSLAILTLIALELLGLLSSSVTATIVLGIVELGGMSLQWNLRDRHLERLKERAFYLEGKLCLRCGFRLEGLPEVHTCPECGQKYELPSTQRAWAGWLEKQGRGDAAWQKREQEDFARTRSRKTCIRCGHDITASPTRICPACGATHGYEKLEDF